MTEDFLPCGYKFLQDSRFFKLGQDSVHLSEFAYIKKGSKICDIGCGTGVISLLILGRDESYKVTGIEVQEDVLKLAEKNREINNLQDRFDIILGDARKIKDYLPANSFDYVISNPPYFEEGSGKASENEKKRTARQEGSLNIEQLVKAASYLLKFGGKFALVHRPERICDIISQMKAGNIEPKKIRFIHGNIDIKPSAVMIEGRYGSAAGCEVLPPLIVDRR